jgi:hypothetical protein
MCAEGDHCRRGACFLFALTGRITHGVITFSCGDRLTDMFRSDGHLKWTTIAALMLGLGACYMYRPHSSWVQLPAEGQIARTPHGYAPGENRKPSSYAFSWIAQSWRASRLNSCFIL